MRNAKARRETFRPVPRWQRESHLLFAARVEALTTMTIVSSIRRCQSRLGQTGLPRAIVSLAVAFFAVACPSQASFDRASGRPSSVESNLLADAADGRLDEHSLLEAVLIAGGLTSDVQLAKPRTQFEKLAAELAQELDATFPAGERAEAIHAFLHRRALKEYRADASHVAETLESGVYNCVSGSVLFVALAERQGLSAHAVQLPEHVRCEVIADDLAKSVEMTSLSASLVRSSRQRPRVLSAVALLATIYYNRGVVAFDAGDLESAISLNTIAVELDPACQPARENLLAAINNRVVELMKGHQAREALELLEHGLSIAPDYRPLVANRAYLLKQGR